MLATVAKRDEDRPGHEKAHSERVSHPLARRSTSPIRATVIRFPQTIAPSFCWA